MSFLGNIVKKVGHVIAAPAKGLVHAVTDPGGWAKNIGHQATDPKTLIGLASALALPGVGGALTGALGAVPGIGGALASGAGAIGSGLGAAEGAVGGALSHIPGASAVGSALGLGGGGAAEEAASAIPDSALGIGSGPTGLSGLLGKAGSFLTANGGKNALGLAQGVNAAMQSKKQNDLANQALKTVEGSYNERAPLRAQGLQGLMRKDTGNPYAGAF